MKLFVKTMIAILLTVVASAPSQARYACAVKRTADGFVALRKGPSAQDPVAGTMKPQELVRLLHPPDYENIVRKGDWLFVRWSPGTRRTADHIPDVDESKERTGWVKDKLIDCFEE